MSDEFYMVIKKGDAWVVCGEMSPTVFTKDQVEKEYTKLVLSFGPENVKVLKWVQMKVEVKATLVEEKPVPFTDKDTLAKEQLAHELKEEKAKSGHPRLDDLLYGGIPFGKQVLVMGPPFIGKETLTNNFLLEAVTKGIPVLILTTDSSTTDIIDEMTYILPDVNKYIEKGLIKFVDAYSKAMGMEGDDVPWITVVDHPTDYKGINKAIGEFTESCKAQGKMWRMVVRSVSALVTLSDPTTSYRFLQNLTGRAKKDKAIVMYLLDKGMHNEQEIQTLGHLMDGAIECKTDGIKTFLAIQGICDVQSRMWIQYQYSKRGLNIGSFTLNHIG